MSFWRFGKSDKSDEPSKDKAKSVDISSPISGSLHRNIHMAVGEDGTIEGVPDEWKEIMENIYKFNDLKPTEENLIQASNIVKTSLKRKKTINEGKVMKIIDEEDSYSETAPAALRKKSSTQGPRVNRKMKKNEIMSELQNLCHLSSPWTEYRWVGR